MEEEQSADLSGYGAQEVRCAGGIARGRFAGRMECWRYDNPCDAGAARRCWREHNTPGLCVGTLQKRKLRIGFPPSRKESLIGSLRLAPVYGKHEHSSQLQVRQHTYGIQSHNPALIENLLKLRRRLGITVTGIAEVSVGSEPLLEFQ